MSLRNTPDDLCDVCIYEDKCPDVVPDDKLYGGSLLQEQLDNSTGSLRGNLRNSSIFGNRKYGDYDSYSHCPLLGEYQKRERCRFVDNSLDKIYYQVRVQSGNSLSSTDPTPSPPQPLHDDHHLNGQNSSLPVNDDLLQNANVVYQRLLNDLQQQLQPIPLKRGRTSISDSINHGLSSTIFPPPPPPLTCLDTLTMPTMGINSPLGNSLMSLPEDKQIELQQLSMTISKLQQQLTAGLQSVGLLNESLNNHPVSPWAKESNASWHGNDYGTLSSIKTNASVPSKPRVTFADQVESTFDCSNQTNPTSLSSNELNTNSLLNSSQMTEENLCNLEKSLLQQVEQSKVNETSNDQEDNISVYDNVIASNESHVTLLDSSSVVAT